MNMNKSDYSLITITFRNFRRACRHHGGLRTGNATYPDTGICRQGSNPKRCYRKRCPLLKELEWK